MTPPHPRSWSSSRRSGRLSYSGSLSLSYSFSLLLLICITDSTLHFPLYSTALGPASGSDPVTLALSQLNEPDVLGAPFFYFGED